MCPPAPTSADEGSEPLLEIVPSPRSDLGRRPDPAPAGGASAPPDGSAHPPSPSTSPTAPAKDPPADAAASRSGEAAAARAASGAETALLSDPARARAALARAASEGATSEAETGGLTEPPPAAQPPAPEGTPLPEPIEDAPTGGAGLAALASNREPTLPPMPLGGRGPTRIGPYTVLSVAGEGAMAVVYKAMQPSLERVVAIKSLRNRYVHDPQVSTRFSREAASLATMQHGSIVHVYEYLHDADGAHIVMEFVDGVDLYNVLNHTQRLPLEVALPIAIAVAEGLQHAHHQGIVHRDIKPSNILLSKQGDVKLMDFGIARDHHLDNLTQTGLAVGTPSYMAPEQIRGDPVDFRTDLFALSVVLYELLSGKKPWPERPGRAVTVQVLDDPPVPLTEVAPHVPAGLVRLIHRCLQKRPQQRYRSTHEFCRDLARFSSGAIDPRARVALFLFNRQLIGAEEASRAVPPRLQQDLALRRIDLGLLPPPPKPFIRQLFTRFGIALGLITLTLLASWGLMRPPPRPSLELSTVGQAPPGDGLGGLLVVVPPDRWAKVEVDGVDRATTPFAAPIQLSAGPHQLRLHNPNGELQERIWITAGQTTWVRRELPEP